MPRILITGNGFDLHHNLPTSYNDFVNVTEQLAQIESYTFENIYGTLKSFNQLKNTFDNELIFDLDNIKLMNEIANKNILFIFFKTEFTIETWIDFENKLEYLLSNIFNGIKIFRENIVSKGPINAQKLYSFKDLNNQVVYIEILSFLKIINLISSQQFTFNSDYFIKKYEYFVDIDEEKILDKIHSQLIEFRKLFNLYLQNFVNPLYENYKIEKPLVKIFSDIHYYFTFNYTPTFEKLYNNTNLKANYLHGKSEPDKENIVFGIDKLFSDELENNFYIRFTKYFQKFNNKTDFYYLNEIKEGVHENYIFYFWGHSLDKSDSNYINEVFNFIDNAKSTIKRIVIIYHDESSRARLLINLLNIRTKEDIEMKIRNKILLFYRNDSLELKNDLSQNLKRQLYF